MYALGVLLDQRGEPERAAELVERSLAAFREQDDHKRVGAALNSLGSIRRALGDPEAGALASRGEPRRPRDLGDEAGTASTRGNLGNLAFEQGDLDDAEARFLEELELDRAHGNEWGPAQRWIASRRSRSNAGTTSARGSSTARCSCQHSG